MSRAFYDNHRPTAERILEHYVSSGGTSYSKANHGEHFMVKFLAKDYPTMEITKVWGLLDITIRAGVTIGLVYWHDEESVINEWMEGMYLSNLEGLQTPLGM